MKGFFSRMNPTVRGLAIVALVAAVVVVLQLQATLTALFLIARIAFFIAIAAFLYFLWRDRRGDISMWSKRAQWTFYGAVALVIADLGWFSLGGGHQGLDAFAFFVVLILGGLAIFRIWREQHRYG
ncbi:MAG TPA: hypothetical protein VIU86_18810 [Gaiellaceae bacterium]